MSRRPTPLSRLLEEVEGGGEVGSPATGLAIVTSDRGFAAYDVPILPA